MSEIKEEALFQEPVEAIDTYTKVKQEHLAKKEAEQELNRNVDAVVGLNKLVDETKEWTAFQDILKDIQKSDRKAVDKLNYANEKFLTFLCDTTYNANIDHRILEKKPRSYEEFKIHKEHFESLDNILKAEKEKVESAKLLTGVDQKPTDPTRKIYEDLNDIFSPFWRNRQVRA